MSIVAQSRRLLRQAAGAVLDGLLPGSCLLCGEHDRSPLVCQACEADLPHLGPGACPRCAEPDCGGQWCAHCLRHPPHFDRAWALWRYEHPLDALLHALKYRNELGLAAWFGHRLAPMLFAHSTDWDCLVPLPLHPQRLAERGFNQSREVARHLGPRLNLPVMPELCRRQLATRPQAELPLAERHANIRGAFHCPGMLTGRRILLLDDVMTTGATLNECARTLKLHGALQVDVLAVARTCHHT